MPNHESEEAARKALQSRLARFYDAKVHENRLRRMAKRQGYYLVKNRRRDPRARDYGLFLLSTIDTNIGQMGGWVTLADVERFLTEDVAA